jgi:hypothetical protein
MRKLIAGLIAALTIGAAMPATPVLAAGYPGERYDRNHRYDHRDRWERRDDRRWRRHHRRDDRPGYRGYRSNRAAWCAAHYRSYNWRTGYYRDWNGRRRHCG